VRFTLAPIASLPSQQQDSKIIRRANIGPTIPTQRLGCSRWPNLGRTLSCQLRRSTNHANHVPTLDQRLVADWVIAKSIQQTIGPLANVWI
jgi:hypothetical protein